MYGKRKRRRSPKARRRLARKTWLDKRGRSQRLMESAGWPDRTVIPRGRC
mgnify:CR=1 FL=1